MIKFVQFTCLMIAFSLTMSVASEEQTIMGKIIEVSTPKVNENIKKHKDDIENDKNIKWRFMERRIENAVDTLFHPIYMNIGPYLDYHYSIKGDYENMGKGLSDWWNDSHKVEEDIKNKILGGSFNQKYEDQIEFLDQEFKDLTKQHISVISQYSTENIDMTKNPDILDPILNTIKNSTAISSLASGGVVIAAAFGAKVGVKVASAIAAKATAKLGTKVATKGAAKGLTKAGAAAAGAGTLGTTFAVGCAGTIIGAPVAPICAAAGGLIGGTIAWFATDYAVVKGDEFFTRDDLKSDISSSVDQQKDALKRKLKQQYKDKWDEISDVVIDSFENTPISEKIDNLF